MPKRYGKATRARLKRNRIFGGKTAGELLVELSDFVQQRNARRAVPTLSPGQIAFHGGLTAVLGYKKEQA
jgi:hypothetical protein